MLPVPLQLCVDLLQMLLLLHLRHTIILLRLREGVTVVRRRLLQGRTVVLQPLLRMLELQDTLLVMSKVPLLKVAQEAGVAKKELADTPRSERTRREPAKSTVGGRLGAREILQREMERRVESE